MLLLTFCCCFQAAEVPIVKLNPLNILTVKAEGEKELREVCHTVGLIYRFQARHSDVAVCAVIVVCRFVEHVLLTFVFCLKISGTQLGANRRTVSNVLFSDT